MFRISNCLLGWALIALLTIAAPVSSQETGDTGSYGSDNSGPSGEGAPTGRSPATQVTTLAQLSTRISQMKTMCTAAGSYVADCLAERLATLSQDASGLHGHKELKQILRDTAEELRLLVRENSDGDAPRARISSADGQRSTRPLVAVPPSRRPSVHRQAIAILEEAETQLLRSSTQSAARASQYQQVAAALGSNKVLLRS